MRGGRGGFRGRGRGRGRGGRGAGVSADRSRLRELDQSESEDDISEASETPESNEVSVQPKTISAKTRLGKAGASAPVAIPVKRPSTDSRTSEKTDSSEGVTQRVRRSMGKLKKDENGDELCVQIVPKLCVEIVPKFARESEESKEVSNEPKEDVKQGPKKKDIAVSNKGKDKSEDSKEIIKEKGDRVKEVPKEKETTATDADSDNIESKELRSRQSTVKLKETPTGKAATKTEKVSNAKETKGKAASPGAASPALPRGRPRQAVILPAAELDASSDEGEDDTVQVVQRTLRTRGAKASDVKVEKTKDTKSVKDKDKPIELPTKAVKDKSTEPLTKTVKDNKPTETLETKTKDIEAKSKDLPAAVKKDKPKEDEKPAVAEVSAKPEIVRKRPGRPRKQEENAQATKGINDGRSLRGTQEELKATQDKKDKSDDSKTEDVMENKSDRRRSTRAQKVTVEEQVNETKSAKVGEDQNDDILKVEVKMPTRRGVAKGQEPKTENKDETKNHEESKDIVEKVENVIDDQTVAAKDGKTESVDSKIEKNKEPTKEEEKKEIVDISTKVTSKEEAATEEKLEIKEKVEAPEKDKPKEDEKPAVAEVKAKPEIARKRPGRPRKQEPNVQATESIKKTIPDTPESSGANKKLDVSPASDTSESLRKTGRRVNKRWTGPYPDDDFVSGTELSDLEDKPESVEAKMINEALDQSTDSEPKGQKSASPSKEPEIPGKELMEKVSLQTEDSKASVEITNWEDTPPVIIKDSLPSHILSAPNLFNYHHYPPDLELGPCRVVLTKLEVSPEEAVRRLKMIEMMMQSKQSKKVLIENIPEMTEEEANQKSKEVPNKDSDKDIGEEKAKELTTDVTENNVVSTESKATADSGADQEVPVAKDEITEKEEVPKKRRGRPPGKKKATEVCITSISSSSNKDVSYL